MNLKKIIISFVVLFLGVVLVACDKEVENLAETYIQNINLLNPAAIVDDIQLQKKISGQGSVTWVSDNEAVVKIEEYVDETLAASFFKGSVTRPAVGEEDVVVTLTVTYTLDGQTATREIKIKVLAEPAALSISEILSMSVGDEVLAEGVVAALAPKGFLLSDETEMIYVYQNATPTVLVGDTVKVSGKIAVYHSAKQISNPTITKLNTEAGTYTYPEAVKVTADSLAKLYNKDSKNFNNLYEIKGIIELKGTYNDIYIKDFENPDIAIYLQYSYINAENATLFKGKNGAVVSFKAYSVCLDNDYYDDVVALMYLDQTFVEYTDTVAYLTVSGRNMIDIVNPRQYEATLYPAVEDTTVIWSTSDEEIATVDETGRVTALAVGEVDIIATVGNITNKKTITVVEELADPTTVNIAGDAEIVEFGIANYTSSVEPENADPSVTWSVDDETIATIDQTGKLIANKVGKVTVKATATGTEVFGTKEVNVVAMEISDISTLLPTLSATPQTVSLKGEIVGIAAKGWYLADSTGYVYIHLNKTPTGVTVGDTVRIAVKKAQIYLNTNNYVYQMDARGDGEIYVYPIEEDFTEIPTVDKAIDTFEYDNKTDVTKDYVEAMGTMEVYGKKWVSVTGKLIKFGSYNNLYLESATNKVMIDYNTDAEALARLGYLIDETITLKGLVYGFNKTNGWSITFFNRDGDLKQGDTVLEVKPTIMKVDEIKNELRNYYPNQVEENITLDFASTLYPDAAFKYSSNKPESLSNEGIVVRGTEDVEVTLTMSVYLDGNTAGDADGTIDIVINVIAEGGVPLSTIYSTGFEADEGFVATSSYQNTDPRYQGAEGAQWAIIMGAVTTTGKITDLQSLQMRSYTSLPDTYGSAITNFNIANAHKVTFKANAYNNPGTALKVYYSTDGGTTWLGEETFTIVKAVGEFTYNLPEGGVNNVRFKPEHALKGVEIEQLMNLQ